jgi:hypothetical protein
MNLTELTKQNANMQKTIITFVKREKQLVGDLNQVKVDTRAKDEKIYQLEKKILGIQKYNQELVDSNADMNDANEHLIRNFNYYYKDQKINELNNGPRKPSAIEMT